MGFEPTTKTVIILSDQHDDHNGWATVYPYPIINVRLTPPDIESSINAYENWLQSTIIHEYTHILNLIPVSGWLKPLRNIFGWVVITNGTLPRWHLEGLATYMETHLTNQGRGNSPYFNMILRSAVYENLLGSPTFASVDQLNENLPWWPRGNTPYLFGYEFYDYLVDNFGKDTIKEFNIQNSGRIPYTFEGLTKNLTGNDSEGLFQNIWQKLNAKFRPQIDKIIEEGITETKKITDRNTTIVGPQYSPDGKIIAYFEYSPNHDGRLIFYYTLEGKEVHVKEAGRITGAHQLAWSPDGDKLIFTQLKKYKVLNYYRDLFEFDLKRVKLTRLTWGLRADCTSYSPDGKRIFFVLDYQGIQYLAVTNADATKPNIPEIHLKTLKGTIIENKIFKEPPVYDRHTSLIIEGSPFERLSSVRTYERGKRGDFILFLVKDDRGDQRIVELDVKKAELKFFPIPLQEIRDPTYTPNGENILFSATSNGVTNLFILQTSTGKIIRTTNVLGAAFQPTISPAGTKFAFIEESAKGLNVVESDFDIASFPTVFENISSTSQTSKSPEHHQMLVSSNIWSDDYNPFKYVFPTWWVPWLDLVQRGIRIGGVTGGGDPLGEWNYIFDIGWDSRSKKFNWSVDVDYNKFTPITSTSYSDLTFLIAAEDVFQRERQWKTSLTWPIDFLIEKTTFQPRVYLRDTSFTNLNLPTVLFLGGGAQLNFERYFRFAYSVTNELGIRMGVSIDRLLSTTVLNDFDYWYAKGSLTGYLPLNFPTRHTVLASRAAIGWTEGAPINYAYFQVGEEVPYVFTGGEFLLRGFGINALLGKRPVVFNLELRAPVWQAWQGWGTLPLFLKQMYVVPFFDLGTQDYDDSPLKYGTGAEIRFNFTAGYQLPVTLRTGVHHGFGSLGSTLGFVGIAQEF